MKFLNFGSIQEDIQGKVKQDLKFKTGKFVWRVRFSAPLDPATVNNKNLDVTNTADVPLKTSIRYNSESREIEIEPLEAYAKDSTYFLHVSKRVRSVGGQNLKSDISLEFKV